MSKKNSRTKNTFINTGAGFLTRISNMIARFMLQTTLIKVLGIQYTGVSGLFTSVLTILSLAELGIGNAITFELYKPLEEKNYKRIGALMNFYKYAYTFIAFFILTIGVGLIPFLNIFVKDVPDIKESIVLIYIMFILKNAVTYLLVYKSTLLIANQKNYIVLKIQAIMCLLRTVLECGVVLITKNYFTYLIIEIIANVAQNIIISRRVDIEYPEIKKYKNLKLDKKEQRNMFRSIKGLAMYRASFALGNGVDNIIISSVVGTGIVGLVSNYNLIVKEIDQIIKQFYNAVIPSVGNLSVTESKEKQHQVFLRLVFIDFWISCFCAVSYFILIQPFITLWLGEKYLYPLALPAVLAFDFYLASMLSPISSFRNANGIFVKGQYRPLIMTIINVFLSILLGIKIGAVGVFLATIISRLVTQWYDPYLLYKLVFKRSSKMFFLKYYFYMLLTILCALIVINIAAIVQINNALGEIVFRSLLCITIPNVIVIALFHKTDEFTYCTKQISNIISKIKMQISG